MSTLFRYWSQDAVFLGFMFCCFPLWRPGIGDVARVRTVSRTVIGAIQYHKVLDPWMKTRAHDFMKGRHGSLLSVGSVTIVTHWWLLDADWSNLAAFPLQAAVNQGDAAIGAS